MILPVVIAMLATGPLAPPPLVGPSPAGLAEAADSDLDRLVSQLDSDILDVREHAQERLAQSNLTVRALVALMSRPGLSAEQTERLAQLGEAAMRASPRAALGVSFDLNERPEDEGVRITMLLKPEFFPAAKVLRAGDVLMRLGGMRVRSTYDARVAIVSGDPGQSIEAEILRDNVPMKLQVPLGRWSDLERDRNRFGDGLTESLLRQAWSVRLEREGLASKVATVDAKLPRGAWSGAMAEVEADDSERLPWTTRPTGSRRRNEGVDVAAAGTSKASRRVDLTMAGGRLQDSSDRGPRTAQPPMRRLLEMRVGQIRQNLEMVRRIAQDPNQQAETRASARAAMDALDAQLKQAEGQLKDFEAANR